MVGILDSNRPSEDRIVWTRTPILYKKGTKVLYIGGVRQNKNGDVELLGNVIGKSVEPLGKTIKG